MNKYEVINKWIFIFILAVVIIGAWIIEPGSELGSNCIFKNITGLFCPLCGMTHSFDSIIRLNIVQSLRYNALGLLTFILMAFIALKLIAEIVFGRRFHLKFLEHKYFPLTIIMIFLIYGILRNIF